MAPVAIGFGVLLILVGLAGYFGTGTESVTALIPAFVGLPLLLLGLLALKESLRKHAMHAAAAVGLLGFLASAGRLLWTRFAGTTAAVLSQASMAVLCAVFVGLCVKSFIDARRARENKAAGGT
jgi:uncharacterized membrane protein